MSTAERTLRADLEKMRGQHGPDIRARLTVHFSCKEDYLSDHAKSAKVEFTFYELCGDRSFDRAFAGYTLGL